MKSNSSQVNATGFEQAQNVAFQTPPLLDNANESPGASQIANRRYGFTIGNFHFLAPQGLFCELLVDLDITPLPSAPSHLVGLSNHRGNIIPIYTLAPLLGLPPIKSKYTYLIGQPADGAALLIKEKPMLIDLTEAESADNESLPAILRGCVDYSSIKNNMTWHALKHDVLFHKLASTR